ncbi:hypothetical protein WMY93_002243 [Mugilogobius chulae]|uniref:DUF6589 domain-containing protein n=1 Tax=Mugilogobius chulae TaxID=88201 RepID=A0AAW0Q344_9GOBI
MAITTNFSNAIGKQKEMAAMWRGCAETVVSCAETPFSHLPEFEDAQPVLTTTSFTQQCPPSTYTIIFDNLDFYFPLGLLFKNENQTADLVDVLQELQKKYVPRGPEGVSTVLVGGDRLTEGNCRNIQWAFADGATKEERLEGLVFMFEDWHAVRNLLQIHHKIFFKQESSKDHGTLFANMNVLR